MQKQYSQLLFIAAGTFALAGAIAHLMKVLHSPYLFSVGAAVLIFLQAKNVSDTWNEPVRERRLARSAFFSTLLLALAAYFMFTGSNSWVVALLIYALSSLALSFRGK